MFEKENRSRSIFILLLFLCFVKIPNMFTADIQPWDEGLYATRVNSIHINGDFFEQVSHSIGGFDSGSHPPIFIWLGFFATSIFGQSEFVLKIIPFIFGLLCVLYIVKLGELMFDFRTGFLSAMIFSSTYLFTVYAKRFQFDIAVTFLIILSFYFFLKFLKTNNTKFFYFSAISFGICLMTKSLVGFFIPVILFVLYSFSFRGVNSIKISQIIHFTLIGIAIALPWHLYMFIKYGCEFTDFLFGFHLLERAVAGVDNYASEKSLLYYASVLMNNVPFAALLVIPLAKNFLNFKNINKEQLLIWCWFITGFMVISVFATKIDAYLIPFLVPSVVLLVLYLLEKTKRTSPEIFVMLLLLSVNVFWFVTSSVRNEVKVYFSELNFEGIILWVIVFIIVVLLCLSISNRFASRINVPEIFKYIIITFFLCSNIYYSFNVTGFEDGYKLSGIKKLCDESGRKKIVYVSTDFQYNPQFTYYFDGIDLGWHGEYNYELLDLKYGTERVRKQLDELEYNEYIIIVERDDINPGEYYDVELFIPGNLRLVKKTHGYEMYFN